MLKRVTVFLLLLGDLVRGTPECDLGLKEGEEVVCMCKNQETSYTGNLNFVKQQLSRVASRVPTGRGVDLWIKDCDSLSLELNFNNIGLQPVNLRIYQSRVVEITEVELAALEDRRQSLVVKNVTNLTMSGLVRCRGCQDSGKELLNVQIERVASFNIMNLNSSVALKVTGRHLDFVRIYDSSFLLLPWPGIFFHNSSRVELLRNRFLQARPRSISIKQGDTINISHNLLDVAEVLKVEQYEHAVVRCNKPNESVILPATCNIPLLEYQPVPELTVVNDEEIVEHEKVTVASVNESDNDNAVLMTILGTTDVTGFIWVIVTVFSALCFLLVFGVHRCCVSSRSRGATIGSSEPLKTASSMRPDLMMPVLEEEDEYSESSRTHLAQDHHRMAPQFVTVQGVRSEPMEDGVVCGSLTLGPSFSCPQDSNGIRTVSNNILKQQAFSKV